MTTYVLVLASLLLLLLVEASNELDSCVQLMPSKGIARNRSRIRNPVSVVLILLYLHWLVFKRLMCILVTLYIDVRTYH